jgi:DNA-binding HxlR family transcriptional regulator
MFPSTGLSKTRGRCAPRSGPAPWRQVGTISRRGGRSAERGADASCAGLLSLLSPSVELIGRRWTGAILEILIQGGSLRFSQIASAVADLSDRMLSDRLKELEAYGLVKRTVHPGPPVRVEYALTRKGEELAPALDELKRWARAWLDAAVYDGTRVSGDSRIRRSPRRPRRPSATPRSAR